MSRIELTGVRAVPLLAACAVALCAAGCGNEVELGTVTGKVTLDGKPLAGANVNFAPETGRGSNGKTDGEGRYELTYTIDKQGALVGKHTVRISTRVVDQGTGKVIRPELVPAKYMQTPLTGEVKPGSNQIDLKLTSN